jgi:hypothetical protein
MFSGIFGVMTKEKKIGYLLHMNKDSDLTLSPIKDHPEYFNLNEFRIKSNSKKDRKEFLEDVKSFESGNRPPKYDWEEDKTVSFIPKNSIKTRKQAEAFLESVGSNKDDVYKPE